MRVWVLFPEHGQRPYGAFSDLTGAVNYLTNCRPVESDDVEVGPLIGETVKLTLPTGLGFWERHYVVRLTTIYN